MYRWYVHGRDTLGLEFKRHRTHEAFKLAKSSPISAWRKACSENKGVGNPHLPAPFKALLEVIGVILLACYGAKRWRWLAAAGILLLSQTASEQSGGGEESPPVEDFGSVCRICGAPLMQRWDGDSTWYSCPNCDADE